MSDGTRTAAQEESPPSDRRAQMRRANDRAIDDLQSTFSTSLCRSCLERMADGVLLLDSDARVMYATPSVEEMARKEDAPFSVSPCFALSEPENARRLAAFLAGKQRTTGPFHLLLEREDERYPLLFTCFRLPEPTVPDLRVARHMVLLRDPGHFPQEQWCVFTEQFRLTPAEARLCRALADGLSLADYCEKYRVSAHTARDALKDVFDKTSTRRQVDLLRLIFLFTRS